MRLSLAQRLTAGLRPRPGHQLVPICTLDTPGRLLGEQALLPGHRHRNATVVALEQSLIVELPPQVFEQLLNADPNAQARLQSQSLDELRERLQRLGIGLDATLVDPAISSSIQLAAGDVLLAAGKVPERAYSVVAGRLSQPCGRLRVESPCSCSALAHWWECRN